MKIRGNTIGTPLKPEKNLVKATDLIEEEKAQARANIGAVASVNGTTPDENGNVQIETGGGSAEGASLDLDLILTDIPLVEGHFVNVNGNVIANAAWSATDYIQVKDVPITPTIYYNVKAFANTAIGLYNANKTALGAIPITDSASVTACEGVLTEADFGEAYYIKIPCLTNYESKRVAYGKSVINASSITKEHIAPNAVTAENIADFAVSIGKIGFLTHLNGTNLIDKTKLVIGRYIGTNGQLAGEHSSSAANFRVTDYIKLETGMDYYYNKLFGGYYAFYDAEYNVVEAVGNVPNSLKKPFRIPAGAVYGRFTMLNAANAEAAWIHTDSIKPTEYGYALDGVGLNADKPTEFDGDDICVFSKGICIGDSLTQGTMNYIVEGGDNEYINIAKYSYPTILTKLTGIPFDNKGLGGKTSDEWYAAEADTDLSGYDIAIIQLGVNDSIRYSDWTDTSVTGFTNIINKLKAENKNIKIFVATIMPAISYNGTKIDAVSQGIREFVTSLNDDDVILLDMARYAHTGESEGFNCGHLSAYGYWRLAKDYKAYISWYMSNHKKQFREVQFIGTDYVYTVTS